MIKIHRWICEECEKKGWNPHKWYVKIDDTDLIDIQRLDDFETHVSLHVFQFGHTVKHSEKGETVFKYV